MAKAVRSSAGKKKDSSKPLPVPKAAAISSRAKISTKAHASSDKSSSESSDDSSEDDSTSSEGPAEAVAVPNTKFKKTASDSSSDSSHSDDSEGDEEKPKSIQIKAPNSDLQSKDEDSESEAEDSKSGKAEKSDDDSDSEDSKSDSTSGSGVDSSDSDSESVEDKDVEMPEAPSANTGKKRKAEAGAPALQKKAKLTNDVTTPTVTSNDQETTSIFVGKLSWNVDDDWLAQEFASCGEVRSAHVQVDRTTGRSRGFGYVNFTSAEAVEKALTMDGKEIDSRAIRVDKSNPPDKKAHSEKRAQAFNDKQSPSTNVLFVGNLSFGASEDTLWETFGEHGEVNSVRIPTDRESGRPKGFAYVEFRDVQSAQKAYNTLQGSELAGRSVRLDFSQPRDASGGRGGGPGGRGRGRRPDRGYRGGRGDRGARGGPRGFRGGRTGNIAAFEGQKIMFN